MWLWVEVTSTESRNSWFCLANHFIKNNRLLGAERGNLVGGSDDAIKSHSMLLDL